MSDYRSHIRTEWPPERITAALQELAGAETERAHDVTCKFCRKTGSYKIPQADGKLRLEALRFASEHGYGKAAQAKEIDSKPLEITKPVANMTKAERDNAKAIILARLGTAPEQGNYDLP
jgi:hypothetical protein